MGPKNNLLERFKWPHLRGNRRRKRKGPKKDRSGAGGRKGGEKDPWQERGN